MIDIAKAQLMLDELKKSYVAELPSKFDELELLVLKVKKKDNFVEDMGELHRKVHSLKGSSGTHGLHDLSKVCHRLEDYMRDVDGRESAVGLNDANMWISHIDLMRRVLDAHTENEPLDDDVEQLLDALVNSGPAAQAELSYTGLIVDQSKANALMYQNALSDLPINFTLMTDGYNALDVLLNNRIDLLVTSMEVRKLNGLALIGAVKLAHGLSKDVKAVIVTSNPKAIICEGAIGPDKVLVKGAQMTDRLLETSREMLGIPE